MYYLLEDNRIVNSEELKRKFPLEAKIGIIDNELIATLENFPIFRSENKIKKQSENVYDLIDWEKDLIKVNDNICGCRLMPNWRLEILRENNYLIDVIYKPDEKGNYIKVWEKKDES